MRIACLVLALAVVAPAAEPPSAQEIVSRMTAMNEARAAALHAYQSKRIYRVSYKGFPEDLTAKVVVRLDFKAADQKRFTILTQEGSSLLVNRVVKKALDSEAEAAKPEFHKRSVLDESNYGFELIGNDEVDGRPCFLLQVTPKREDKYLYQGKVWIDESDYAVVRIDSKPAKNPSFWISRAHIESRNQKVGEFWLPLSTRSTSHVRLGGNAELDIEYGDYQITGTPPMQPAGQ